MIEALILLCELCCVVLVLLNARKNIKNGTETASGFFAYIDNQAAQKPGKGTQRA